MRGPAPLPSDLVEATAQRWLVIEPGSGCLDLRCQTVQGSFVAIAHHELHGKGQAIGGVPEL